MRHTHTDPARRFNFVAFQNSDGYVDALLGLTRRQIVALWPALSHRPLRVTFPRDPQYGAARSRADLH